MRRSDQAAVGVACARGAAASDAVLRSAALALQLARLEAEQAGLAAAAAAWRVSWPERHIRYFIGRNLRRSPASTNELAP